MLNATRKIASSRIGAVAVGATILATVGGTSAAVAHGLITSEDIVNQTIQKRDIGRGAVGMGEVRNHSLGMRDFNRYTRDKINEGTGSTGPQGPTGPAGPAGENGVSGYEVHASEVRWGAGKENVSTVDCPGDKVALGGGYDMTGTANGTVSDVSIVTNAPVFADGVATGWTVAGDSTGEVNVKAWVTCATMR